MHDWLGSAACYSNIYENMVLDMKKIVKYLVKTISLGKRFVPSVKKKSALVCCACGRSDHLSFASPYNNNLNAKGPKMKWIVKNKDTK